jgi:hypothetical protein
LRDQVASCWIDLTNSISESRMYKKRRRRQHRPCCSVASVQKGKGVKVWLIRLGFGWLAAFSIFLQNFDSHAFVATD